MAKPKLALYWAASCGGCDVAVLDIEVKILDVAAFFDIVFWPCATDFKYKDVEAMPDKSITLCLFNGSIRNSENEKLAKLLRAKSVVLVAFGSCAQEGCIPALANLTTKEAIFKTVYLDTPSTHNPDKIFPQPVTKVKEGDLEIPVFWEKVKSLDQVVDVDYYIPGCPPQSTQVAAVIEAVIDILKNGKPLPPKGTILGAGDKTCCDECPRTRKEKKVKQFYRLHEILINPDECLLDQGIVCMGPATRSGCGALCVKANVPCRGCYGAPPNVHDQGLKMLSAISSVIDAQEPDEIDKIINTIADPTGTFYRFSMAHSTLKIADL
jgi:F420-non-reducing hydrogenase small subunit